MGINFCFWICLFPILEAIKNSCLGVPGGCWQKGDGQQLRQLEDEEGACAALSVLRVVSTVSKPYHQEVRQ